MMLTTIARNGKIIFISPRQLATITTGRPYSFASLTFASFAFSVDIICYTYKAVKNKVFF